METQQEEVGLEEPVLAKAERGPVSEEYRSLAERLPSIAESAPLTFCGMSACIDATIKITDLEPFLNDACPPEAIAFASMLKERAARGVGGEVRVEWPEGPVWLMERLSPRYSLGGTGPHAAWVLSTLGADAILNLEDRSEHMLSKLPEAVLLVEDGKLVSSRKASARGTRRANIFIFEYTAGIAIGNVVPKRSTRIIVRFDDPGLEHDSDFEAFTRDHAAIAGSGLVAGFSAIPEDMLDAELERVSSLTRAWAAAGLKTIHLEMSGFQSDPPRDRIVDAIPGSGLTSIGMSHSEFLDMHPRGIELHDLPHAMSAMGEWLGLRRVCVHADQWAVSVTRDNPEIERQALMAGCLLASSRAAAGRPVALLDIPERAHFDPLPFGSASGPGGWNTVIVPSPYLAQPVTTLGLGDTFTAGCLLILGVCRDTHEQRINASQL
jgi:ADP-dependent phosphofructokinase/glucokinase